jgi:hypothetical protein
MRLIAILILLLVALGAAGSGWIWAALAILFWPILLLAGVLTLLGSVAFAIWVFDR